MSKTEKKQNKKNNTTQKNKNLKFKKNVNECQYKSCKSKMYNSLYGGRYTTNMFI
jgi:translation initiation factor IF-3